MTLHLLWIYLKQILFHCNVLFQVPIHWELEGHEKHYIVNSKPLIRSSWLKSILVVNLIGGLRQATVSPLTICNMMIIILTYFTGLFLELRSHLNILKCCINTQCFDRDGIYSFRSKELKNHIEQEIRTKVNQLRQGTTNFVTISFASNEFWFNLVSINSRIKKV